MLHVLLEHILSKVRTMNFDHFDVEILENCNNIYILYNIHQR